ncbi:MAG: glycerophosphodiester phosphodiesterase, partial [Planctomycetes bacterium]|nr:glycerophosphodiester phosphodiesterase [Planctomycetota bacterium]
MVARWTPHACIAHRGGSHLAPENTLPAYEQAAGLGHTCGECDVQLTADGVPVLLHDDTLERTTDGHGRLIDRSAADVLALDAGSWFHPRWAGTRVPTLAQALAAWSRLGMAPVIELKCGDGQDPARLGVAVSAMVAAAWSGPTPLLISFIPEALSAAATTAPLLPRGLLLEAWCDDWRERAAAVGACCLDIHHGLATAARAAA